MTILISAGILGCALACAFLASDGLTGAMRRIALWLVQSARKIDRRRAARDATVRKELAAEGGAL